MITAARMAALRSMSLRVTGANRGGFSGSSGMPAGVSLSSGTRLCGAVSSDMDVGSPPQRIAHPVDQAAGAASWQPATPPRGGGVRAQHPTGSVRRVDLGLLDDRPLVREFLEAVVAVVAAVAACADAPERQALLGPVDHPAVDGHAS